MFVIHLNDDKQSDSVAATHLQQDHRSRIFIIIITPARGWLVAASLHKQSFLKTVDFVIQAAEKNIPS